MQISQPSVGSDRSRVDHYAQHHVTSLAGESSRRLSIRRTIHHQRISVFDSSSERMIAEFQIIITIIKDQVLIIESIKESTVGKGETKSYDRHEKYWSVLMCSESFSDGAIKRSANHGAMERLNVHHYYI
jgi:hypothetical protein